MDFLEAALKKAKLLQKRIVLTEGIEPQTVKAARVLLNEGLAFSVTLLGKESEIYTVAGKEGVDLTDVEIVNPELSDDFERYAAEYYEHRKTKGITLEQAKIDIQKPLYWGAMMVQLGDADAVVGGAEDNSMDVINAGLAIIDTVSDIKTASSCTIVISQDTSWGVDGAFVFSDCSIVPNPTPEQLTDIALSAAKSCRDFFGIEPVVALLSYSTKGSKARHKDLDKVRTALEMIKNREPSLIIDGEMQIDAALIPQVTDFIAPGSPVRGKVNTLVFPDLDAGNIAYQIARSFGKAETFGPFLQGFSKPISYIPHGSEANKIVLICAAALARAG